MTVWSASPSHQARRRDRRRLLWGSIPTSFEPSSSTGSLGLHIVTILEHSAAPVLAGNIRQAGFFLRCCGHVDFLVLGGRGRGSAMRPRYWGPPRQPPAHSVRRLPEPAGNLDWVNAGLPPPRALVARAVHRAVMPATEWDRELIADLAAERTGLGEPEVVGVRGLAAAHETRLLGGVAQVLPVAIATRGSEREDALVDALRLTRGGGFGADGFLQPSRQSHRRIVVRGSISFGRWELQ